ncbi:response regulator [bacterium]|nr:response regulator [bacterium]
MKKNYNIVIADRDSRVRDFLKREMTLAGYRVYQAKNGFEVMNQLAGKKSMDLLILDPDFPDTDESEILSHVAENFPSLPIIVHTYLYNKQITPSSDNTIVFVEKQGNSIDLLIKNVTDILQKNHAG